MARKIVDRIRAADRAAAGHDKAHVGHVSGHHTLCDSNGETHKESETVVRAFKSYSSSFGINTSPSSRFAYLCMALGSMRRHAIRLRTSAQNAEESQNLILRLDVCII